MASVYDIPEILIKFLQGNLVKLFNGDVLKIFEMIYISKEHYEVFYFIEGSFYIMLTNL